MWLNTVSYSSSPVLCLSSFHVSFRLISVQLYNSLHYNGCMMETSEKEEKDEKVTW